MRALFAVPVAPAVHHEAVHDVLDERREGLVADAAIRDDDARLRFAAIRDAGVRRVVGPQRSAAVAADAVRGGDGV